MQEIVIHIHHVAKSRKRRKPTKNIWVDAENHKHPVKRMDSNYLVNVIRYVRRRAAEDLDEASKFRGGFRPKYECATTEYLVKEHIRKVVPTWEALCKEAVRRGLDKSPLVYPYL